MIKSVDLTPSPKLRRELDQAYNRVMSSGNYIGGIEVERFEHRWSEYNQQNYCVAVGNGFDAIQLILRAHGIGNNDFVYVPDWTATPTWSSVNSIQAFPTGMHRANFPLKKNAIHKPAIFVNLYGQQCEIDTRFKTPIEDCAQSHGLMPRTTAAWCLGGDTSIQMANGKNKTISSLYGDNSIGETVIGFDKDLNCVESKILQVSKSDYTGEMFDISIERAFAIHATAEHKFPIMRNGFIEWISSKDLSVGDFVIAPKKIAGGDIKYKEKIDLESATDEQKIAYLSGLVASDGCMYSYKRDGQDRNIISIVNTCDIVINNAKRMIENFTNYSIAISESAQGELRKSIKCVRSGNLSLFAAVSDMNENIALKQISTQAYWLAGFADGDGGFSVQGKNKCMLTFSTATKHDTNLVKRLLLNIGIYASVVHRKPNIRNWKNGRVSYCKDFFYLQVTGSDARRFLETISFRQKKRLTRAERFLSERIDDEHACNKSYGNAMDNVPVGSLLKDTRKSCGKLTYKNKALSAGTISWAEKGKYRISRNHLIDLCKEWDCVNGEMWDLANSDVGWLKITAINKRHVYNLSVYDIATETENFCAEFVFVHNSFYPTKNLGAYGDSGAITTDDWILYDHIKLLHDYGCDYAINSRMDPLQAAFLDVKLDYLDEWNCMRKCQASIYSLYLRNLDITMPDMSIPSVFHQYVIRTKTNSERDALKLYLYEHGAETQIHYKQTPSMNLFGTPSTPEAELFSQTCLSLPIGPHLTVGDAVTVSELVKSFYMNNRGATQ